MEKTKKETKMRTQARRAKKPRNTALKLDQILKNGDLLQAAAGKRGAAEKAPNKASEPMKKPAPRRNPAAVGSAAKPKTARPNSRGEQKKASSSAAVVPAPVQQNPAPAARRSRKGGKLRIIPLGGLDEIGKNMTVFEYGDDLIIVDCGMAFPNEDMLGVDCVIPDISYLRKNLTKIRGIFLTHGHEDHIGALPYVLREINVPIYGHKLTLGLVRRKLTEFRMDKSAVLMETAPGSVITCGCFRVEFIPVNHSIPDASAFAIRTPVGLIVHTGDFKIDTTPIQGRSIDLARFGELGKEGVLLLMSDSTNAGSPGLASSEKTVGKAFLPIFESAKDKRIIIASFASHIHRIQQIIDASVQFGRKVACSGRSIEGVVTVAQELGYLKIPKGTWIPLEQVSNFPPGKITLITTGSQGEPMSALYRMAFSDHHTISVTANDLVIISASPIPGNERLVSRVMNELEKLGATVIDIKKAPVHVSGHARQEELKLMLGLIKPRFFMPVHGEYHHLTAHVNLAREMGIPNDRLFIGMIGNVLELDRNSMKLAGSVPSGQVLIDGSGIGDVGNIVLKDRKTLAEEGIILAVAAIDKTTRRVSGGPEIVSRGFIYMRENEDLIGEAREIVSKTLQKGLDADFTDYASLKNEMRNTLSTFISQKTKRNPIIIPVILTV